jgi:hypothetical protein
MRSTNPRVRVLLAKVRFSNLGVRCPLTKVGRLDLSEESLLLKVGVTNVSVRFLLGAGSFSPHFGSISPRARSALPRCAPGRARACSFDGRFGSSHERVDGDSRSIDSIRDRPIRSVLGPVRSLLPSLPSSLRVGSRHVPFGSIPPLLVRRLLILVRSVLPSRASPDPRGS